MLVGAVLSCGATPVPVSDTVWGLPAALSLIFRLADSAAFVAGVKARFTVVFAPGASEIGNVAALSAKSPAFVPVIESAEMTSVAEPLFVTVTAVGLLVVPFS